MHPLQEGTPLVRGDPSGLGRGMAGAGGGEGLTPQSRGTNPSGLGSELPPLLHVNTVVTAMVKAGGQVGNMRPNFP